MKTVPLDVAPERRTKRCSPRFRPGGRFWSQDSHTCRQAVRERGVGPYTNDYSSNFDFHIVRAGTHGVFTSAIIEREKKIDRPQPGAYLQNLRLTKPQT